MPLCKLTRGFLEFCSGTFLPQRAPFAQLALEPQPRVIRLLRCAGHPAILSDAEPHDLFMVRNVANLVPPGLIDRARRPGVELGCPAGAPLRAGQRPGARPGLEKDGEAS